MAWKKIDDTKLTAIADAIRGKTGGTDALTLDAMPTEIAAIETGSSGGLSVAAEVCNITVVNNTSMRVIFYHTRVFYDTDTYGSHYPQSFVVQSKEEYPFYSIIKGTIVAILAMDDDNNDAVVSLTVSPANAIDFRITSGYSRYIGIIHESAPDEITITIN